MELFVFEPSIFAGVPVCASKNTLCGTDSKARVTVSPADTVSAAGANASDAEAVIVRGSGGGGGDEIPPYPPDQPPQAAAVSAARIVIRRVLRVICLFLIVSL